MKRFLFTVYATVSLGCFFGKAQSVSTINGSPVTFIPTAPVNISQFEVRGKLITQNSTTAVPTSLTQTGSFDPTASWNSMGNINFNVNPTTPLTQTINGFRSQTRGRGLAWGYSIPAAGQPNAGVLTSPFIEWIGNNIAPNNIAPGSLEFKYALNPTGAASARVPIFTMKPAITQNIFLPPTIVPAFCYAEADALVGQLQSGAFGSFNFADKWSATGQVFTPSFTTYGTRHQYEGVTLINGLIKSNGNNRVDAVIDYGSAATTQLGQIFKFRSFSDPTIPSTIKNIWQSSNRFSNIVLGRQDYGAVNSRPFYLSLFDGAASSTSSTALNFVDRAGIYVTADGNSPDGIPLNTYAAIVGDVSEVNNLTSKYAILGIGVPLNPSQLSVSQWAGYFIGDVGYTGVLTQVSDKKFKTQIKSEDGILAKLMQLAPKNYMFDVEKYKNIGLSNKLQHGLISQEVEAIFPELVQTAFAPNTSKDKNEDGKPIEYKGLNYIGFIPMLLKGIQELKIENDALKTKIENLEVRNNNNTYVINDKNNLPAEIENKAFSLSQNTPNPFSEKTTISYSIPTNINKTTLVVFDMTGKMLLQYNLQAGKNNLVINGNTLQAGMYIYTLLADGQEVVSKRMVLTK